MDDRLYSDPHLVQFYDLENGWAADCDRCQETARGRASILDLGCGTGLFAASLAREQGGTVVGVDSAAAMLNIAAKRQGGEQVSWVQGDARTIRLGRRFDLVVLMGHAFQVVLTYADRAAVLRTIADHLAPAGLFVFDSRNPAAEAWRRWTPERSRRHVDHSSLGRVLAWNDASHDPATAVVTYSTFYELADGRCHSAQSRIAFPSRDEIASLIGEAGLSVREWLGDWSGAPWSATSPEIIAVGSV